MQLQVSAAEFIKKSCPSNANRFSDKVISNIEQLLAVAYKRWMNLESFTK